MRHGSVVLSLCGIIASTLLASSATAGALTVVSKSPAALNLNAPIASPIVINFDQPVMTSTFNDNTVYVFGRWSGAKTGTFTFTNSNMTVTFDPDQNFSAGEQVMVALSKDLKASDGTNLRAAGYSWQFWTRTRPAAMTWGAMPVFSNRTGGSGGPQTRIYGASGTDFNEDGYLDLATVNEVSEDVRVFLNLADDTGNYQQPFLTPQAIGAESSPNEPADFNRDGHADLCAVAATGSSVTILLGNGTGAFTSTQTVAVGLNPHGVAILDANGDGAMDIATANTANSNVSLLLNNGSGVFAPAVNFTTTGSGEYALGAGDMNNDGILDLVVGAMSTQDAIVLRGNGNGTFTEISSQDAGGNIWMLTLGDVNGDGNLDVASANGSSNNGSILLGNGAGSLAAAVTYANYRPNSVATDLGDLDGDGDLDWELSSFGGCVGSDCGGWRIYRNNGAGVFTHVVDFNAIQNGSCSILMDIDNDRDLDVVQTDEIDDTIRRQKNSGLARLGDFNNDNDVDAADFTQFTNCFTGAGMPTTQACDAGDFDGDGDCDCDDHEAFQIAWTAGGSPPDYAPCLASIPAVSTWGLIAIGLIMLCAGTIVSRRQAVAI